MDVNETYIPGAEVGERHFAEIKEVFGCPVCATKLDLTKILKAKAYVAVKSTLGHIVVFLNFFTMAIWHFVIAYAIAKYLDAPLFVYGFYVLAQIGSWANYGSTFVRQMEVLVKKEKFYHAALESLDEK